MVVVSCHDDDVKTISRSIRSALAVAILSLGIGTPALATLPPDSSATVEENVYLDLDRSLTECVSAMPKPGCGREPVDSGDRGGWQQTLVFAVLMVGMAGIGVRVAFATRARARSQSQN